MARQQRLSKHNKNIFLSQEVTGDGDLAGGAKSVAVIGAAKSAPAPGALPNTGQAPKSRKGTRHVKKVAALPKNTFEIEELKSLEDALRLRERWFND
jgi:hypothetical protein